MRDLGLVKVDEPFTKLLTQGMVLNHIYSRKSAKGGKNRASGRIDVNTSTTGRKIIGAAENPAESSDGLLPVGTAIDYEGVGNEGPSPKNNGVDPQQLIENGADTRPPVIPCSPPPPELTLGGTTPPWKAATASCAACTTSRSSSQAWTKTPPTPACKA